MRTQILKSVAFGCMGVVTLILISATLIEKFYGTPFALTNIYHAGWFIALWSVLTVSAMIYILSVSRRHTLIMFHVSLAIILSGALISFLTSLHGNIILVKDSVPASMFITGDGKLEKLPFSLQVTDIDTILSKDKTQPIDYKASITVDNKKEIGRFNASLNKPMKVKGYTFCIKGIPDNTLSLLVSHDTYGLPISYTGYLMMFVSFMMLFIDKQSGYYCIIQQLKRGNATKDKEENIHYRNFTSRISRILPLPFILLCILWYSRGVFPVISGSESLFFLATILAIIAMIFKKRDKRSNIPSILFITASAVALAAMCSYERNNEIQPILRTPLLGIHVTTIITAYALLCCTAINATIALCCKSSERRARMALSGRALLYPATMLLATGIFIGAIWANISWGRYWGWDPKEVWALITLLVCSFAFHTRSLPFISKPGFFHAYCIVVFAMMLFTYLGVNYILGGIHSYA